MTDRWFALDAPGPGTHLFALQRDGQSVGSCCLLADESGTEVFLLDVATNAPLSDSDAGDVRAAVAATARQLGGATLMVRRSPLDAVANAIVSAGPHELAASRMIQSLRDPLVIDDRVVDVELRPMTPSEYATFEEHMILMYADSRARAGAVSSERSVEQARQQTAALLPEGAATPHHFLLQGDVNSESVGFLWLFEETGDAGSRGYVYDVEVMESARGRGYGRGIMVAAERFLRARNVAFIELNVFGFNTLARSLYLSLGYVVSEEFYSLHLST